MFFKGFIFFGPNLKSAVLSHHASSPNSFRGSSVCQGPNLKSAALSHRSSSPNSVRGSSVCQGPNQLREILRTPVSSDLANPFSGNPWPKDITIHILTKFHSDWIRFRVATVKNIVFFGIFNFPDAI